MKTEFKIDKKNQEFLQAIKELQVNNKHVYLTGKAGTGKTTFLKHIKSISKKKMVIVAPTGVAAINAGGETINSFFQIPYTPFPPNDIRLQPDNYIKKDNIFKTFNYDSNKLQLIKNMELLIIDEISMVGCDTLDVIDSILRNFRNSNDPFGGVQLLMIGDAYQLSPIKKEEDWNILKRHYNTPYFFSSKAFESLNYTYAELKKIYRQKDSIFINLLNSVRENKLTEIELNKLNKRYLPCNNLDLTKYILLASHNYQVDDVNKRELDKIKAEEFVFIANKEGVCDSKNVPAPYELSLKVGARVMFVKNDNNNEYYNGKLGKVVELSKEKIMVLCDDGKLVQVSKSCWENNKYSFDSDNSIVTQENKGKFTQYPLKLAWAITIHKSQGLTFDFVIADLGKAFAEGQVYVALSRCTSVEGLILKTPITRRCIKLSEEVVEFAKEREGRMQF